MKCKICSKEIRIKDEADETKVAQAIKLHYSRIHKKDLGGYGDYLEKEYNITINKCGFCEEFSSFRAYYKILDGIWILSYINYESADSRFRKKESAEYYCYDKNCIGKTLNPNSIEFVSTAYNITKGEATDKIHNRNNTPFYRTSHQTDEDYKKYQVRNEKWYFDNKQTGAWDVYKTRQAYTNSLIYFEEKYGRELGGKLWRDYNKKKSHTLQSFIERYGGRGEDKWVEYKKKILMNFVGYSPISQELFWALKEEIESERIYFAELNKEYVRREKNSTNIYFYDFVINDRKICIEYNGEHCHPNKEKLNPEEWDSWRCVYNKSITADAAYEKDMRKQQLLIKDGFKVLNIWHSDYINDKENTIKNILKEING